MKNSRLATACFAALAAAAAQADPITVTDVTIGQNPTSRLVKVNYSLGGDNAIVTVDFLTNGVSIGEKNFSNVFGDVNRLVETNGQTKTVCWQPDKSWPGHTLGNALLTAKVTAWPVDDPPDYLVVPLYSNKHQTVRYYVSTNALPDGGLENREYKRSLLVMRRIHAAGIRWRMGAVDSDFEGATANANNAVKPYETAHYVTLTYDFWMGIYPVTQEQHSLYTGAGYQEETAYAKVRADIDICPRNYIRFDYLRGYNTTNNHELGTTGTCYLRTLREFTGVDFDIPSDAEWEFAARGGTSSLIWSGQPFTQANVEDIEWCYNNTPLETEAAGYSATDADGNIVAGDSKRHSHPVGTKKPNPYGLYDMLGNVYEMCRDFFVEDLGTEERTNPLNPCATNANGSLIRTIRSGNFNRSWTPYCRASYRNYTSDGGSSSMNGYRLMAPITLKFAAAEEPGGEEE